MKITDAQALCASWCVVATGVALHVYIAVFQTAQGPNMFGFAVLAWSCTPYLAAISLARVARCPLFGGVGALAALAVDVWVYVEVFIAPSSSTASLAMLFAPWWSLLVIVAVGSTAAWAARHKTGSLN